MPRLINALIVDDSTMTRKMIMKDLNDSGLAEFQFTEADDGVDALEKFAPGEMDIIFCDMQMPRKDGVEFLRDLRATQSAYPPAVMITSERSMEVLEKAAEVGVSAFLLKPVDKDRLRRGLKKLVDSLPDRAGPSKIPHGETVTQAVREMFSQSCNLELIPEPEDEAVRHGEIVFGLISILGSVEWSVTLGFEKEAACKTAERFAGFEIPFDSPDMGDAVAELINVVAGHVTRLLAARDVDVSISLPVVNTATSLRTIAQRSSICEHQHFDSEAGKIWVSVTLGTNPGLVL